MSCFRPLKGYVDSSGAFVFRRKDSIGQLMTVPCGRCIGCRLDRSRDWAVRCMHEAWLHDDNNCFLTLTYDDDHLPPGGSLVKDELSLFIRRLRKNFPGTEIRFFGCGEYGEKLSRPHYHVLLFGFDFDDKELFKEKSGCKLYTSERLSRVWKRGFSLIGSVSFESAAYVARYVTKKVTGEEAFEHYWSVPDNSGEVVRLLPEFVAMSRQPGIGKGYFDLWGLVDIFPADEVIIKGRSCMPPRYYDKLLERVAPEMYLEVKARRVERMEKFAEQCTDERLEVRERVKLAEFGKLIREFEDEASDIYCV